MKNAPSRPLVAELADPAPRQLARAGLATLLLAAAPVMARLGWWWWSQGRRRNVAAQALLEAPAAAIERTEIEMDRRALGRWRLRVTSTRWQGAAVPAVTREPSAPSRMAWLVPTLRLTRAALEANSRKAPAPVPRLPAPPAQPRS